MDFEYEVPVNKDGTTVGVIMGSQSDWGTMRKACEVLDEFCIPWERRIVSAHRTPSRMDTYALNAQKRGLKIIIAGAGGAAHLPGMVSAITALPVLGVPVKSSILNGIDSLLSIVQMPKGVPTATFAIGDAGAFNAALFAVRMLALMDVCIQERLTEYIANQTELVSKVPIDQ
jgi:5-(carboxyamino)imidazole ribonucleotide mutase